MELPDIQYQEVDDDVAEGVYSIDDGSIESELLGRKGGILSAYSPSQTLSKRHQSEKRVATSRSIKKRQSITRSGKNAKNLESPTSH